MLHFYTEIMNDNLTKKNIEDGHPFYLSVGSDEIGPVSIIELQQLSDYTPIIQAYNRILFMSKYSVQTVSAGREKFVNLLRGCSKQYVERINFKIFMIDLCERIEFDTNIQIENAFHKV